MKDLSSIKNQKLRDTLVLALLFVLFFALGLGCGLCICNSILNLSL